MLAKASETAMGRVFAGRKLGSFLRDENGSLIIFTLFLLIMIIIIAGLGVDVMRAETDRARLQSTLDRAVLAGASLEQTLDSEDIVRDYFAVEGLADHLTSVTVVPGLNTKSVSATAQFYTQSYFINMLGIDQLSAPAAGRAEESLADIEISLVLDVSGSMGWTSSASGNTKIDDLIAAAENFVYLMQCNPDDPTAATPVCTVEADTVSISIIPYSEQVSVGETLLSQFNVTTEHTGSSCVDFAVTDFNTPGISLAATLQRSSELDPWTNYNYRSTSSSYAYDQNRSCRPWSSREIQPFGNDYAQLQTFIGNLTASGNTSIDLGMKWAAALLDPQFRPVVQNLTAGASPMINPVFADRPFDYDERGMQKVIVLMTDGENTSQHYVKAGFRSGPAPIWRDPDTNRLSGYRSSSNSYYWPHARQWHSYPYDAYSSNVYQMTYEEFWATYNGDMYEEAFSFLPDAFDSYGYSTKNSRLDAICDAAKADDIEIFTIGFETTQASNAIMEQCASSASHHFDVDGLDLSDAFSAIAREIHELRLTN